MPEFVRVTDEVKPRREYSVPAEQVGDHHEVLDKPGAYPDGTPIPPKYTPESIETPPVAKKGDQPANPSKEK